MSKYPQSLFNVVLIEPQIPTNTGNIGRTRVGTWSKLQLVGPLGFEINDKQLKRAGLDYWPHLDWEFFEEVLNFCLKLPGYSSKMYNIEKHKI